MRKNRRHDWRNMPPKKMIRSTSALRLAMKQWGVNTVEMNKIGEEVFKSLMRGFWDELFGYSVAKRGDVYEHTYTVKREDEPTWITVINETVPEERHYKAMFPPDHKLELEMKVSDVDVSFALYNQLI